MTEPRHLHLTHADTQAEQQIRDQEENRWREIEHRRTGHLPPAVEPLDTPAPTPRPTPPVRKPPASVRQRSAGRPRPTAPAAKQPAPATRATAPKPAADDSVRLSRREFEAVRRLIENYLGTYADHRHATTYPAASR